MLLVRVFLPFALGYYLSYLYRVINAIIYVDLARDLGLAAGALGLLTSAYLLPFALAQPVIGLLLDRFGPRRVHGSLLVVCAIGAVAFSFGVTLTHLVIARAIIGLGVAAALMASMKAFSLWFPIDRLASVNGALLAVGGIGAMSATAPVEALLHLTDWRGVFGGLAVLTFIAAAVVLLLVPPDRAQAKGDDLRALIAGLAQVLGAREFWRIALLMLTSIGVSTALQGLWLGPWMRDVLGASRNEVAWTLLAVMFAMTAGFIGFGLVADRLARRGADPLRLMTASLLVSVALLTALALGVTAGGPLLWIAYNFFVTAGVLGYAILSRRFDTRLVGRVTTSLNMVAFVGAFAAQYGFGALLDLWPREAGRYPPAAYQVAIACIVVAQVLALGWSHLTRAAPGERVRLSS